MAKNNAPLIFHGNTVQENKRILHELKNKSQMEAKTKEELRKLFSKLNQSCKVKSVKEETQHNSAWYCKNVTDYTYGPITGFPSGSWWGIRMDCSRDRIHDPFDEDFQAGPFGVTSICTSSTNVNEDADFGEMLTLTGQKYLGNEMDGDPVMKNYENQIPIRLVRSYNLLNEFAPKTGYRYDGLYMVIDCWIGVNTDTTKCYKFALARIGEQEPPPWNTSTSTLIGKNRFSTVYSESQSIENCSKCSSFGRYEFRKYSHGSTPVCKRMKYEKVAEGRKIFDIENTGMLGKQKSVPESAIVTRHVFKKTNPNIENVSLPSTSSINDNKSLLNIGTQASKAHSTNISIRTGLYDSSHSVQHDVKKNTSVSFCRVPKPITILKTSMHMENYNLANRDKSKVDGKVDAPKVPNKQTDSIVYSQNMAGNVPVTKEIIALLQSPKQTTYPSGSAAKPELETSKLASLEANKDQNSVKDTADFKQSIDSEKKNACITGEEKSKSNTNSVELISHKMSESSLVENVATLVNTVPEEDQSMLGIPESSYMQGLKSLGPLDSLTPDKILNLINKEKYHPLSTLLMGNMIGLTTEQSAALRMQGTLTSQKQNDKGAAGKTGVEEGVEKKSFKATTDDIIGSRCYKFRRRRRLAKRMLNNKSDIGKADQVNGNKVQEDIQYAALDRKPCLRSTLQQAERDAYQNGYDSAQNKKYSRTGNKHHLRSTVDSKNEIRTRLRTIRGIRSSVKKRVHKKQGREIANLSIDAKIGPKMRGPRNRRLRCINPMYTKRAYERFSTVISTLNSDRTDFNKRSRLPKVDGRLRTKTASMKRSDRLALKGRGRSRNLDISPDPTYQKKKEGIVTDDVVSRASRRSRDTSIKDVQTTNTIGRRGRKRKFVQTVSVGLNSNDLNEHLWKDPDKVTAKPCTADAVTQCTLISEEYVGGLILTNAKDRRSNGGPARCTDENDQDVIKVECNDSKDLKSEEYEVMLSDDENADEYQVYQSYLSRTCSEVHRCCKHAECNTQYRGLANSEYGINEEEPSGEHISAFVPVKTLDNDLRIARLRSIGFRPIISHSPFIDEEESDNQSDNKCSIASTSDTMKQDAVENYNEYSNDESNIVLYLGEELQYQNIENEDKKLLLEKQRLSNANVSVESVLRKRDLKGESLERVSSDMMLEQDSEPPWHGWKKVVTNEDSYWIGW